jgi:hypothetical protein
VTMGYHRIMHVSAEMNMNYCRHSYLNNLLDHSITSVSDNADVKSKVQPLKVTSTRFAESYKNGAVS